MPGTNPRQRRKLKTNVGGSKAPKNAHRTQQAVKRQQKTVAKYNSLCVFV